MKLKPKKKGPNAGDRRTVHRFAWLPVTLTNGIRIWLERYFKTQQYVGGGSEPWDRNDGYWFTAFRGQKSKV